MAIKLAPPERELKGWENYSVGLIVCLSATSPKIISIGDVP
jgi:hypothetical protein